MVVTGCFPGTETHPHIFSQWEVCKDDMGEGTGLTSGDGLLHSGAEQSAALPGKVERLSVGMITGDTKEMAQNPQQQSIG